MSPTTQELLDQCKNNAQELVKELEKFKSSTAVNKSAADSFEKVSLALEKVLKEIRPFTDLRFRLFQRLIIGWSALNTILLIAAVVIFWLKK